MSAERSVVRIQLAARISKFRLVVSLILPDVKWYRVSLDLETQHVCRYVLETSSQGLRPESAAALAVS